MSTPLNTSLLPVITLPLSPPLLLLLSHYSLHSPCHPPPSLLPCRPPSSLLSQHSFPKYFTFRARNGFEEDTIYRHLEPALAFQLEINRLSNFDIRALPCQNHRMHLYLGSAKVAAGQAVTDHRFFIRTIIRHSDFVSRVSPHKCSHFIFGFVWRLQKC